MEHSTNMCCCTINGTNDQLHTSATQDTAQACTQFRDPRERRIISAGVWGSLGR